jgi:hypothetical protein
MSRSYLRQDAQIRRSITYDDTTAPTLAAYETNPVSLEDDMNNLRSQVQNLLNRNGASFPTGNWYDDITAPSTFENGTERGVIELNQQLHDLERKRILRDVCSLVDVAVPASQNYVILGTGELPTQTTAAVGAVTTLGTVVATHAGTFGTHSLDEVAGSSAVSPKNLMIIVDGATRDPILSGGRTVYGLLQGESGLTDGGTITDTTTTRVQISFVRINAAGDDLEAVPVADIQSTTINYCTRERVALEDLNEQDFLRGAIVDDPAAGAVNRQNVYNNQGITPVDLTTNAILDIEGAGLYWEIRDDLEATLFRVTEGSAGGTSTVAIENDVDFFDVDAADNDFLNGVTIDSGSASPIDIGVTDGHVETTAGDLHIQGANEIFFDDVNQTGSTWAQTDGIKLSETTAEWDNFETVFGEVSLLNAIVQAANSAANRSKGVAVVTAATIAADTNVTGAGGSPNIDAQLPDYSTVTSFVTDVDVYLNGQLLRNGVDAAANHDVYPGVSPANGDLRFEFGLQGSPGNPDVITMIVWDIV